MSTPQIIRTAEELEELEELDRDAYLITRSGLCRSACWFNAVLSSKIRYTTILPAVVIATGEQVRAARKALEGEAKPARPDAHEMQGILGSEWLNGEDPADLVRKHREGRA